MSENLKLSEFIMTNRKLEVINLMTTDLEIIEEHDFDGINLRTYPFLSNLGGF